MSIVADWFRYAGHTSFLKGETDGQHDGSHRMRGSGGGFAGADCVAAQEERGGIARPQTMFDLTALRAAWDAVLCCAR
jgi:hypothetical protein